MSAPVKGTKPQPRPLAGDETAKKNAAVILEVLAGLRTPQGAAETLGITSMRYYVLERRAMEGMVQSLAPRPKGKQKRPENTLAEVRREKERLEREVGRLQALVRVSERRMHLPPPPSRGKKTEGGKRRPRRPQVRAEKIITLLRAPDTQPAPTP